MTKHPSMRLRQLRCLLKIWGVAFQVVPSLCSVFGRHVHRIQNSLQPSIDRGSYNEAVIPQYKYWMVWVQKNILNPKPQPLNPKIKKFGYLAPAPQGKVFSEHKIAGMPKPSARGHPTLNPAKPCNLESTLVIYDFRYKQSVMVLASLALPKLHTPNCIVPLQYIEHGFGYTILRSPYTPYSIYLRGTIYSQEL